MPASVFASAAPACMLAQSITKTFAGNRELLDAKRAVAGRQPGQSEMAGTAGAAPGGAPGAAPDADVVDADFKEVDDKK